MFDTLTISSCFFLVLKMAGLLPIHFACGLHGEEGIHITRMLLDSLADPDARANEDESYLNHFLVRNLIPGILIPYLFKSRFCMTNVRLVATKIRTGEMQ